MKTFTEDLTIDYNNYPLQERYKLDDILFVDIETTGFSAKSSYLYEIGCIFFDQMQPKLIQYFATSYDDEVELLKAFFALCREKQILFHFNGNTFDIPYLKAKAKQFGLQHPFDEMEGIDIFKRISPYKQFLGLENCKQKTIEAYLGIDREDQYNGGQLIEIYKDYVQSHDPELEKLLVLHNNEDMKGMLLLLPILTYSDLFFVPFRVVKVQANHYAGEDHGIKDEVVMKLRFTTPFPRPFAMNKAGCHFTAEGDQGYLKVPLFQEELKYFYANYKDYYYLPEEDVALHKAVASFVDKNHRKQAKASNCYTRKQSNYLPQWDIVFEPLFKRSYEDTACFFELTDDMKKQPEIFQTYALHIVDMIAHAKI